MGSRNWPGKQQGKRGSRNRTQHGQRPGDENEQAESVSETETAWFQQTRRKGRGWRGQIMHNVEPDQGNQATGSREALLGCHGCPVNALLKPAHGVSQLSRWMARLWPKFTIRTHHLSFCGAF